MVISVLNASPAEAAAQMLLSHQLTSFADVDIIAGQKHYPAHRAVLAVHSLDFRDAFSTPPSPPPQSPAPLHVTPANNPNSLSPPPPASAAAPTPLPANPAPAPPTTTTTTTTTTTMTTTLLHPKPPGPTPMLATTPAAAAAAAAAATPVPLSSSLPAPSPYQHQHPQPQPLLLQQQLQLPHLAPQPPPPQPPKLPDRYRVHIALEDVDDSTLSRGWALVYAYIYGATVHLDTEAVLAALPICRRYRFDELAAALDAFLCEGAVSPANCTRVFAAAGVRAVSTATPATNHHHHHPNSKSLSTARTHFHSHQQRQQFPYQQQKQPQSQQPQHQHQQQQQQHQRRRRRDADAQLVQTAAWAVMKSHFSDVADWGHMPYGALVRLLKLNDLHVPSEMTVFDAVVSWVGANRLRVDSDVVAGLVKLVRFPTMAMSELERCAASDLVRDFPVCRKYVSRGLAARADELRGLVRSVVMESSPVYRRRRTDALTFSDRVANWSRVEKNVHTSSRYFAGCLWNLVVEVNETDVGLFLGCMSEAEEREVDVELDFAVFIVRHTGGKAAPAPRIAEQQQQLQQQHQQQQQLQSRGGAAGSGASNNHSHSHSGSNGEEAEPDLVRKEVKGACFSRSGQRIGFVGMLQRAEIEKEAARLLLRDTLFIGASIRLRSSKEYVVGISRDGDDTAESIMTMI